MCTNKLSFYLRRKPYGGGGGTGVHIHLFFNLALDRGKCQSSSPGRISPRKEALYSLNRRNVGPLSLCEVLENRKILAPVRIGNLDRTVQTSP
jgi:hypothetical protein